MDKLDDILVKRYKQMKDKIASRTEECPREALWWSYVRGDLNEKERERIDGHLVACSECLETLKVIRMIHQAQKSPLKVPAPLHQKAREILDRELGKSGLCPAQDSGPLVLSLALIWDRVLGRITQVSSELGAMIPGPLPQLQPVRNARKDQQQQDAGAFPYTRTVSIPEGTVTLEIDHSGRGEYMSLKVSFQSELPEIRDRLSSLRVMLDKSGRICSSVHLDALGEAVFQRIREGNYHLELLTEERSLGVIELFVQYTAGK